MGTLERQSNGPLYSNYGDLYTGRWCVDCYIWYSEEGPGWAVALPRPLLTVSKVVTNFISFDMAL